MDGQRFDRITRALASGTSRRRILRGVLGGVAGGVAVAAGRGNDAEAQVTQAQCGNKTCAKNPAVCNAGCVCCVYANGNSRCRPPGSCRGGTEFCSDGSVPGPEGCGSSGGLGSRCVPSEAGNDGCDPGLRCQGGKGGFICVPEEENIRRTSAPLRRSSGLH